MERREYWKQHSEGQRVSGQSMKEYCASHDLNLNSLQYWRAKLSGKRGGEGMKQSRFIEVHVGRAKSVQPMGPVEPEVVARVTLGDCFVLECLSWPSAEWLRGLKS